MATPKEMTLVFGPKRSGKTHRAIRESAETGAYIVCDSHNEAWRISQQAEKMGLCIPFPITYYDFNSGAFHTRGVPGFIIDNVDKYFRRMGRGVPVKILTFDEDLVRAKYLEATHGSGCSDGGDR